MVIPSQRGGRAWAELVVACKRYHGWTCHLCGQPIPRQSLPVGHPLKYEADHILPWDTHPRLRLVLSNLRPSHGRCNRYRGNRPLTPALIAEITAVYTEQSPPALRFFEAGKNP